MKTLKFLEKIFDAAMTLFISMACVLLCLITFSVCLEVFLRYFFNRPQVWVIEMSEYALLYITFLGAAWVLKEDNHVAVDLVTNRLTLRGKALFSFFSQVVCFLVSWVLVVHGARVTWSYFSKGIYNPTILEFPTAYILVIIPLGGLLILVQAARGGVQNWTLYWKSGTGRESAGGGNESVTG